MSDFEQLGRSISEVDDVMNAWIKKLGLNYSQFAVLYSLASSPNKQCTQKHICEEWLLPKQTVFNVCKEYKEIGWIVFSESAIDKRERILNLTEEGISQAEVILQATTIMSKKTFNHFGEKKTVQLFRLLEEFCLICREQINETNIGNK
ncbi:MarR family winged helix-turn-helix transcriptional regulator [Thiofilum flexile]|uniref:MarR family winged helix-turn-helix transcriptional regulator n=1 Tax=Thiofilum flexile TaxID=125627 RepID=UPI0003793D64|nr:MarR family winged helix-turn-helix transcriptional regulator [Thiofilum flexile]